MHQKRYEHGGYAIMKCVNHKLWFIIRQKIWRFAWFPCAMNSVFGWRLIIKQDDCPNLEKWIIKFDGFIIAEFGVCVFISGEDKHGIGRAMNNFSE